MLESIAAARHPVRMESYIFAAHELTGSLASAVLGAAFLGLAARDKAAGR